MLFLASLCSHYSNAQVLDPTQEYTTGNIVLPTVAGSGTTPWVGGVYQDNLTCWSGGQPGYCGPNAIVRPGNNINFSYGSTYLYQEQAIASILPNSGTGLKVIGYNFGFTAKNGNGWDDGRVDQLSALVRFWDTTGNKAAGNLLYGTSYNLNYKFDWTNFNYSETFASPLSATSIGRVQYGFIGRDNNGWAGPYGPEVNNVSFSLRYSVDQCAVNPLYSTTCPGYAEAYKSYQCSLNPLYDSTCPGYQQAYFTQQCTINPLYDSACPGYAQAYLQQQCSANPLYNFQCSGYGAAMAAQLQQQQKKQEPTSTQPTTQQTQTVVVAEDPTKEPTRVDLGGVETTTTGSIVIPDGIPQVVKESTTAEEKKSAGAPTSLIMSLLRDQRERENKLALDVAARAEKESRSENANPSDGTGLSLANSGIGLQANFSANPTGQDESKQENPKLNNANNLSGVDQKQQNISTESEKQTQTTRRKGEPNEMDSATTIAALTQTPVGFDAYLKGQLTDGTMYAPKEIYKNQKVIDNKRVERILNLQSDIRYEEMVNKQYEMSK